MLPIDEQMPRRRLFLGRKETIPVLLDERNAWLILSNHIIETKDRLAQICCIPLVDAPDNIELDHAWTGRSARRSSDDLD
jgi:hypothetical protein